MIDRIVTQRGVVIRPIRHADARDLAGFYERLAPESRRCRFLGCSMPDARFFATLTGDPGVVAVRRGSNAGTEEIVGHASVQPDGHGGAEVAFAVADEIRGHGLGRRLVSHALRLARELGSDRASATMLAGNVPMRHLLTSAGQPVRADHLEAGTEEIVLDLRVVA